MKMKRLFLMVAFAIALAATTYAQEKIILLNEGNWQMDNGRMTYFENGKIVSNSWFRDVNNMKLGDTPNDIIQINDRLIAIAINWSNIIQFITPEGKAVAATEDVPNNRRLATDGTYVYVSSYGHECMTEQGMRTFTKGFVAKIETRTFKVVDAVEVGYEPEGIAYYKGFLFVANTGGYAFQEAHDYEKTVSIINAETMEKVRDIDTGQINLYGEMSQSGRYLCVNSPGDYYEVPAAAIIIDCEAALSGASHTFTRLDYAATYSTVTGDGKFLAVGSRFSYITYEYLFNCITIDPTLAFESYGSQGVTETLPGTMASDIGKMQSPYGLYVNPYTGYMYATDAGSYAAGGELYQWSPSGQLLGHYGVYINPSHFLALPPDGHFTGISSPAADTGSKLPMYDLSGRQLLSEPRHGIVIQGGKKRVRR